jgi:hypothetical protein
MRLKTLTTASLALVLLAAAQTARAQKDGGAKDKGPKDGEAQAVIFDSHRTILKFTNRRPDKQRCGMFLGRRVLENGEEAISLRVMHMHNRVRIWGGISFPEGGLLFITPKRIVFKVDRGDESHSFDVARADLEEKPVSKLSEFVGVQVNLKERLAASDSREQKFVFLVHGERKRCYRELSETGPYLKFVLRAIHDFDGAAAEFKQLAETLKQAGKVEPPPDRDLGPAYGPEVDPDGEAPPPPPKTTPPPRP